MRILRKRVLRLLAVAGAAGSKTFVIKHEVYDFFRLQTWAQFAIMGATSDEKYIRFGVCSWKAI